MPAIRCLGGQRFRKSDAHEPPPDKWPWTGRDRLARLGNRRPDPPRLSHDGPGLATTPAARGAMTEAILQKMQRLASVSGFVIGTASPVQRPPAARLCPGRLTEDHIRLQGDKLLRQHLRPPGR